MSGFRQPECPREQMVLWTQRLDDALPADHPVRHFEFLLRSSAFAETFADWENDYVLVEGKPPYHPRDLAGLYLYGMMNRIRSSRQLEASSYNRLDLIWLLQGQHPDHSTIADFVKRHGPRLRQLFRDTLRVLLKAKLVKLDHVAVDGTKVEADAGRNSIRSQETIEAELAGLDARIDALEQEWQENESRETSLFGADAPWASKQTGGPRQQLARLERRQAKLRKALAEIGRRQAESSASGREVKAIASVTDPESRVMKDKAGRRKPNYNMQLVVDTEQGAILAHDVSDAAEDSGQLTPMLEQVSTNCGQLPGEASADSQYNTGPELAWLEEKEVVGHLPDCGTSSQERDGDSVAEKVLRKVTRGERVTAEEWAALPRDTTKLLSRVAFRYDARTDEYICPAGQRLRYFRQSQDVKKWGTAYRRHYGRCAACAGCAQASICCRRPEAGRSVTRDQYESQRERMRSRMSTELGRARYRLRRQTVEPRFGQIKSHLGVRRLLHRGLTAVKTEWALVCTAVNIGIVLQHWRAVAGVL